MHFQTVSKVSQKDEYLCLKEESTLLNQHFYLLEQKLYRFSTELTKLRNGHASSAAGQNVDTKDVTEQLQDHIVILESQKEVLQRKLSMAKQQILALGRQAHQSPHIVPVLVQGLQADKVSLTTQTDLIHYVLNSMDDYKGQTKRLLIEPMTVRLTKLELTIQSLKQSFKLMEKELEYPMKEPHKLQTDKLRLTIKYNVDMIRLKKQLCNERTALLVIREKFTVLKQAYEDQLEEGQRSLQKNQGTLLEKVRQLSKQLKQEKQKALILESSLNTATISLHSLEQLQEKVPDIEGERNLLKKNYNALLLSTLSDHKHQNEHESEKESARQEMESWRAKMVLEKMLNAERSERENLEQVKKRILQDYETSQMERAHERAMTSTIKEKCDLLEQEVLQYRQNEKSLQEKLKTVSKDFHMDVEDLSEILMQIKQESSKCLMFPESNDKVQDLSQELAGQQASHAETILELMKTRELLVMQHRLNSDLQAEINIEKERAENEREWRRDVVEKDKLLKNKVLQINKLHDQLRDLTYNYGNCNQIIPHQYRWTEVDQELIQMMEGNTILNQFEDGGSMLEINLKGATFTPVGLRLMRLKEGVDTSCPCEVVTFCTYTFLDYEMQSTPLVSGTQPNYSFTSCFVLTGHNFIKLEGQGVFAHVEVHQALGGVRFSTQGGARIPFIQALQHRGEKVKGIVNISGSNGEIIGVLEFWLHLFSEWKTKDSHTNKITEKIMESMTPQPSNRLKMQRPASLQQGHLPEPKLPTGQAGDQWIQFPSYNQTCHTRSFNHTLNVPDSNPTSTSSKLRNTRCCSKKDKKKAVESSRCLSVRGQIDGEVLESLESLTTNDSDVIIPQPEKPVKEGYTLKIEILSLLLEPSSSVALDQSVQQVYVEYRLLDIPREATETPMSLKKPTQGEEINFNFCRVIHVDYMKAATVRQYLYTKLERTDAKQGRLKFTVISEPLNEEDECVDVGHAYLDLQELLLTGNDVTECIIDIYRMDGDQEVVGKLKVSLEAAQAFSW